MRGASRELFKVREDVGLDGVLELVGEFVAVGAEDLDAVVFPRIVRGGDDDACGEFVFTREIGDAGRGDDSGADDFDARGLESGGEDLADPGAGLAGVLADDDRGLLRTLGETLAECAANGVDRGAVERSSGYSPATPRMPSVPKSSRLNLVGGKALKAGLLLERIFLS